MKSNEALRAEAGKAQADKSHATPIARAQAFAASKGYGFTAEEAKEHVKAKAEANGKKLTDAELDGVAGGKCGAAWRGVCFGDRPICNVDGKPPLGNP